MKIAYVNQPLDGILPPEQNSIGIWTYEVARRLAADHDITVYGRYIDSVKSRGDGRTFDDQGVRYRFVFAAPARAWSELGRLWNRVFGKNRPIFASVLYYIEYCLPVAIRLRFARPDVVHVHNFTGFVAVLRAVNPKVRIVLHMNGEWLSQLDERRMAKRIGQCDAVFGSSNHITGLIQRRFPQFADRCHTVYNGVDPDAFAVDPDRGETGTDGPKIVFVGRVSPEKGIHDLLDAMTIVVERRPDVQLDLIGPVAALPKSFIVDITDDDLVAGLARFYDREYGETITDDVANRLSSNVRLLGSMSHDDVVRHVAGADLLVNPSYSESFGMSLVEAMACQTPVVATRVGGMKEIVDEQTGVLVERADPAALADAIVRLLDDPQRRARMGAAGRRRVAEVFSWDSVAAAAATQYSALVEPLGSGSEAGSRSPR